MKRLVRLPLIPALIFILLFIGACGKSEDSNTTSDSSNTSCLKIVNDSSGNIYIGGHTATTLNSNTIIGEDDIFLIKYASDGTQTWSKLIGTTSYDYLQGMAVTSSDQVLLSGYTFGTLDSNSSAGGVDMILLQAAADGSINWQKQFGSSLDDYAYGVTVDATGDIFVAGHTYGSFPGSGVTASGTKDFVLVKLDSSGNQVWSGQISNDEDNSYSAIYGVYGIDVKTDNAGNVYAAGFTTGGLPGNSSTGGYDLFVTKYSSSGTRLWIKQIGSSSDDYTRSLQVTATGDVYLCGYTTGTLDGQTAAGESDLFLIKLDTDGTVQWIKQTGTTETDIANGIALDSSGKILLTGYSYGSLAGNTAGGLDLVTMKYDTDGTLLWQKQYGSDTTDLSRAISLDSSDNIYLTGYTYGALHGEANTDEVYYSFISRYDASGNQVWTRLF